MNRKWIVLAILVHIIAAWYSVGHYHDDEYHQILNFAAAKLGQTDTEALQWEYQNRLRAGLQPFIASITKPLLTAVKIDSPFVHAFLLRLLSAGLGLLAIGLFIKSLTSEFENRMIYQWTAFFLLFFWLQVFLNVRFSSEGWATSLFLSGYSIYRLNSAKTIPLLLLTGLFFGLAFLARYQVGLMLLGLGLWMILVRRERFQDISIMIIMSFLIVAAGFFIDWWLYNEPVLTTWNYLRTNLLEGRVEAFTHEPWWFYFYYAAVQLIPPITLLFPFALLVFWWIFRKHPITWLTLPFVLFHNYLGHKEMRFLFPMLPFVPVILSMAMERLYQRVHFLQKASITRLLRYTLYLSAGINTILLLLVMTLPASKEVAMWKTCLADFKSSTSELFLSFDADELAAAFYNVNQLQLRAIDSVDDIKSSITTSDIEHVYIATRRAKQAKGLAASGLDYSLHCEITPSWLQLLNVNDWTSRASLWRLWKLDQAR